MHRCRQMCFLSATWESSRGSADSDIDRFAEWSRIWPSSDGAFFSTSISDIPHSHLAVSPSRRWCSSCKTNVNLLELQPQEACKLFCPEANQLCCVWAEAALSWDLKNDRRRCCWIHCVSRPFFTLFHSLSVRTHDSFGHSSIIVDCLYRKLKRVFLS